MELHAKQFIQRGLGVRTPAVGLEGHVAVGADKRGSSGRNSGGVWRTEGGAVEVG